MQEEPKVIYVARTVQDAYLLKNLLSEERIEAVVLNTVLEGGAGVDIVGWPTSARVAVAPANAERARQIAVQFDAQLAAAASAPESDAAEAEAPATVPLEWPRCPMCNAPRVTQCPACGATGSDFRPADAASSIDILDPERAAQATSGPCCGPGGCTPAGTVSEPSAAGDEGVNGEQRESSAATLLVVCPTCDEPFAPTFRRRCEACGFEFADGVDVAPKATPLDSVNVHMLAALAAIVLLLAGIAAYFAMLF